MEDAQVRWVKDGLVIFDVHADKVRYCSTINSIVQLMLASKVRLFLYTIRLKERSSF